MRHLKKQLLAGIVALGFYQSVQSQEPNILLGRQQIEFISPQKQVNSIINKFFSQELRELADFRGTIQGSISPYQAHIEEHNYTIMLRYREDKKRNISTLELRVHDKDSLLTNIYIDRLANGTVDEYLTSTDYPDVYNNQTVREKLTQEAQDEFMSILRLLTQQTYQGTDKYIGDFENKYVRAFEN